MVLFFLKCISILTNLLPRRLALFIGDALGWIWYEIIRFRRDIVLENLRLAFGSSLSENELKQLAYRNFKHYGKVLIEILQSVTWSPKDFLEKLIIEGRENIDPHLKNGHGGFLLTGHLGNWELSIGAVAASGIPLDIVVKEARVRLGEKIQKWYRTRMRVGIFLETRTARDILRSLSQGRFVGFIYDQFMGPPIGLPVSFFGKKAGTVVSLALLTEKKQVPVLPVYTYRDEQGRIHVIIEPALTFPPLSENKAERLFQKAQFFNDVLEAKIRKHPEQWLWLHRRWKEYRGEPRWSLKQAVVGAALAVLCLWFSACTSTGGVPSKTGIELPPDPEIAVPQFHSSESTTEVEDTSMTPEKNTGGGKPVEVEMEPEDRSKGKAAAATEFKKETGKLPENKKSKKEKKLLEQPNVFNAIPKDKIPFEIGERLEIDLGWAALPAGRVAMEVEEGKPIKGRKTFRFVGHVVSSKLVDAIYHVDNSAESDVDQDGLIPYKFSLHMVESSQRKETGVYFDHVKKKAFFRTKRISEKWGNEEVSREDALVPQARDLFSALYFARAMDYSLRKKRSFVVYENGQNWQIELLPIANELITTKVGAFQCWKIRVRVKLNNVLSPTGDVFMWLSDDSRKYLVKFEAKIKIGALVGNLVSLREHK